MKYVIKNDSALFYTCSLIEYIGRERKLESLDVVNAIGEEIIRKIYKYSDVLHCEPIATVAYKYIGMTNMKYGDFDNVAQCKYDPPDYWTIGEFYERLIEDISEKNTVDNIVPVYSSCISKAISNYNTDLYYQSREYIKECYLEGKLYRAISPATNAIPT